MSTVWDQVLNFIEHFENIEQNILKKNYYTMADISCSIQFYWECNKESIMVKFSKLYTTHSAFITINIILMATKPQIQQKTL